MQAVLIFPANFSNDLLHEGRARVQIITDGTDPNTAKTIVNYLTSIISSYQQEKFPAASLRYRILTEPRMLYNEEDNGSMNFIPGVMALILMLVCTALTSVSIVKEKELGTMEILLVSPFKPVMVLVAKAVPYFILSLINFTLILLLSVFLLHIDVKGSILLLYMESALFILTCLSLGVLDFQFYQCTTDGIAHFHDGHDAAYDHIYRIYFSTGEYALDPAYHFKRCAV